MLRIRGYLKKVEREKVISYAFRAVRERQKANEFRNMDEKHRLQWDSFPPEGTLLHIIIELSFTLEPRSETGNVSREKELHIQSVGTEARNCRCSE